MKKGEITLNLLGKLVIITIGVATLIVIMQDGVTKIFENSVERLVG